MKSLFLGFGFSFLTIMVSAQGQLLTNELAPVKTKRHNPQKRFNTNGYAEVFVRINDAHAYSERYQITIADQSIENRTGFYRFFDLGTGVKKLSILENGIPIYRAKILLKNHTRTLLEFLPDEGLFLVNELPIRPDGAVYHPWNTAFSRLPMMNDAEFNNFLNHFKDQSFDDNKLQVFLSQNKVSAFSAEQVLALIREMSFDEKKLELAKQAYPHCVNPQNYYLVSSGFSFSSTNKALTDFILKHQQNP
ncbi:DUF4476 domain-containing protein [Riemerella columbina]|uniref:DUF4476 domain-containing protein n=1 Tax=Riemerella columbina TaxID=103810 RepID=UPI00266FD10D|nr:DUF4476 domain-containing protein [Riemerella columbina]WKS94461.1 DUF4476 domain-containing protein [Riemerella columbina]